METNEEKGEEINLSRIKIDIGSEKNIRDAGKDPKFAVAINLQDLSHNRTLEVVIDSVKQAQEFIFYVSIVANEHNSKVFV